MTPHKSHHGSNERHKVCFCREIRKKYLIIFLKTQTCQELRKKQVNLQNTINRLHTGTPAYSAIFQVHKQTDLINVAKFSYLVLWPTQIQYTFSENSLHLQTGFKLPIPTGASLCCKLETIQTPKIGISESYFLREIGIPKLFLDQ